MAETMQTLEDLSSLKTAAPAEAPKYVQKLDKQGRAYATGKRKDAVARVWVKPGAGKITVNDRTVEVYFARPVLRMLIQQPLTLSNRQGQFDIVCTVSGGGLSGQAGGEDGERFRQRVDLAAEAAANRAAYEMQLVRRQCVDLGGGVEREEQGLSRGMDDDAAVAVRKQRQEGLHERDAPEDVHLKLFAQGLHGQMFDRTADSDAGVADDPDKRFAARAHRLGRSLDGRRHRHVQCDRMHAGA